MIDDREICACAKELIRQHGMNALVEAMQHANALLAKGDVTRHRIVMRIFDRIRQHEQLMSSRMVH